MYEFAKEFHGDRRFRLDFQHLRDMGGDGGKTIENPVSLMEMPKIEEPLRASYRRALLELGAKADVVPASDNSDTTNGPLVLEKAANSGESAGGQRASEHVKGAPYVCYAAKPNSILIRSNGRIGKCTVAFDDERNNLGKLKPDGTLDIDNKLLQQWIRGLGTLDVTDTGCPVSKMQTIQQINGVSKRVVPIKSQVN